MLAIIGGTGFGELAGLEDAESVAAATLYGASNFQKGLLAGVPVLFLPRHGAPPSTPPHAINYRANIIGLKDAGATRIISVNTVGSVDPALPVPALVIPDQIIDYTWGREHTFFNHEIHHIDFTYPFSAGLRQELIALARTIDGVKLVEEGTYGCTQGPRLETAAEVRRLAADGCHIVGMTAMPEAALAAEAGLDYASLSVVVNAGAGLEGEVDLDGIQAAMSEGMSWVAGVVRQFAQSLPS